MNVREAFATMLSASGFSGGEVSVDASLFRSVGARTNLSFGLITVRDLVVQVHIHRTTPHRDSGPEPEDARRGMNPRVTSEPAALLHGGGPDEPGPDGPGAKEDSPKVVDKHLFDVCSTFRFSPDFVFEEKKVVINKIPIHFLRAGDARQLPIYLDRADYPLRNEKFYLQNGELHLSEGLVRRCQPSAWHELCIEDDRFARFMKPGCRRCYEGSGRLLIGVFAVDPGVNLPLEKDNVVFSSDFGPIHLVCVARAGRGLPYRIRSYFYVATDHPRHLDQEANR